MNNYDSSEIINVGVGKDISISELAEMIKDITGFHGNIILDTTKPDGTPKKLLDIGRINKVGWTPKTSLFHGLKNIYEWFKNNYRSLIQQK